MKSITLLSPLAMAILASGYTLYSDNTTVNLNASLVSFAPSGLYIGAAINPTSDSDPVTDPALLVRKDYNMFVAENDCKWAATEPSQNTFNYTGCDAALSFTKSVGATFRGNLCWGSYNPSWLDSGNFTAPQLSSILTNHIKNVAGYYAGKLYGWDVVNEAVADDGSSTPNLKNSTWYPTLPNFIDVAFQAARAADSKAKLFYNDYSAEACGQAKSDAVYALVKDLKTRGIPIHGVGLQMHINTNATSYITRSTVGCNIKRLGDLGLEVHITEMDVRCREGSGDTCDQRLKAYVYQSVLLACLDYPGVCKGFLTWGYTDKYTWLSTFENPDNVDPAPLLNDVNGKQVVAWNEFQAVLKVGSGSTTTTSTTASSSTSSTTKTTTSKTTTQPTTTTTTASSTATGACSAMWGQCGGIQWTGPKCCSAGTCKYQNDYYSQCL